MSTSSELMYAILAMDAYNRGYNPGMVLTGSQIGGATISTDSTEEFRDPGADPEDPTPDQSAGFYAVAYEWNGETVISYRGTDENFVSPWSDSGSDLWNGYGTWAGSPMTEQARLAAGF